MTPFSRKYFPPLKNPNKKPSKAKQQILLSNVICCKWVLWRGDEEADKESIFLSWQDLLMANKGPKDGLANKIHLLYPSLSSQWIICWSNSSYSLQQGAFSGSTGSAIVGHLSKEWSVGQFTFSTKLFLAFLSLFRSKLYRFLKTYIASKGSIF